MSHCQYEPWGSLTYVIDHGYTGTRSELCRDPRVGIAPSTLSNLEAGRRWPTEAIRDRLADALGVAPEMIDRGPKEALALAEPDDDDPLHAKTGLTAAERKTRAQAAANTRWSKVDDRAAATAPARAARLRQFEDIVDPERVLTPTERRRRANNARLANLQQNQLKAAHQRRQASA